MVVHWVDERVFVIVAREFIGSLSNYDDLKKNNRFNDQNNSFARASRFLGHFFDVHWTTT